MMHLTATKITFMHGECNENKCPICKGGTMGDWNEWLHIRLWVTQTGFPKSPWWVVKEETKECYQKLRGNLRHKGFYDK